MNRQDTKQEISHMLDRFMAGETSLNEEQVLAAYFRTHEVGEEWQEYKEMFALFDNGTVDIQPEAVEPSKHSARHAVIGRATIVKWLAAAAAVLVVLLMTTMQSEKPLKTDSRHVATVKPLHQERKTAIAEVSVPQTRKPAPHKPEVTIYAAVLPEIEFCPENHEVQLPQVSKERSFTLVCKVILPEVTAYSDSTILQRSTEIMVACDEIEYNDKPFKNV